MNLLLPNFAFLQETNQWYRLFTVALTHGSLIHLAFNMYVLMVLGNPLEEAYGAQKLLKVFFIALFTASIASSYFAQSNSVSVGASGAVFGLFGALLIVGEEINIKISPIIFIIGLNFAIGFVIGGVDWRAHLGGLIGGALASKFIMQKRKS
jgi:membrane associated rhomboid family serine protease